MALLPRPRLYPNPELPCECPSLRLISTVFVLSCLLVYIFKTQSFVLHNPSTFLLALEGDTERLIHLVLVGIVMMHVK